VKTNKRLLFIIDILFLAALFWVVRYWHSRHFGLYEDDLTILPNNFTRSFSSLISYIYFYISHMYGHSRPLSDSFIFLFSWLGWRTVGLWGPYIVGYLITAINISLFYWLMRRVTTNRPFALLTGLGYVLYSADTTQAFLTHSLGLQPSTVLILLALHSYLSNKRILAYGLAFIVLFSYETPFLLFVAAPLLKKTWNKALLKEILWHVVVVIGMLGVIYFLRASFSEDRVIDLGLKDMIMTPILHVLEGPIVSLGTFAYRPYQTIRALDPEIGLAIVVSFAVILWIISRLSVTAQVSARVIWRAIKDPFSRRALPEEIKTLGRVLIIGIIMLAAAYPLTFTVRAYAISGRETRAHFAGAAGAALLVASFALILILVTNGTNWRKLVNILISLELACMVGYGFVIQRDYVMAWQYQREFWTELMPLIPDAREGTVILVDPAALHDTRQIDANTWNLPRVLGQLYIFPEEEKNIPVVHRLRAGWQNLLVKGDGRFMISTSTLSSVIKTSSEYDSHNIILIQAEKGHLVRRMEIELNGLDFQLKPSSEPVLPFLPHGNLFPLLITEP
jgi:hypothetical protein